MFWYVAPVGSAYSRLGGKSTVSANNLTASASPMPMTAREGGREGGVEESREEKGKEEEGGREAMEGSRLFLISTAASQHNSQLERGGREGGEGGREGGGWDG